MNLKKITLSVLAGVVVFFTLSGAISYGHVKEPIDIKPIVLGPSPLPPPDPWDCNIDPTGCKDGEVPPSGCPWYWPWCGQRSVK